MKLKISLLLTLLTLIGCSQKKTEEALEIIPIEHASFVLKTEATTIFVDPAVKANFFNQYGTPDIVLLTDIHGDHLNIETLKSLKIDQNTKIIAPQAVADKLPETFKSKTIVMNNGATKTILDIPIEAIPMYNLREEAKQFHPKGRGNGYLLTLDNKRIYISGDTEDIPEMRNLKNIDIAFVCMNLPYTMTVDKAAEAVLDFAPKTVYPYHYRGQDGKSDIGKFKELTTSESKDIEVKLLEWYP
ncbi:MBL fold metallo-hydrolase [Neptunitalea lumnitzerae]|uniref:Metal-dependent hydrolase n=1 Tax=Neptunitalea lumnitzerae TaxID=2965509 RepID=A0ABQ5MK41_9FLAO|nr:MBL fold metallo-hydrolase [Neptunitalea sp. Y10]GLB49772.1 metal-dependent hydrolase [Neptunitalea sp. Y10]